jgi:hypothetical protein
LEQVTPTNKELPMLSYPSGLQVSTRALRLLTDALRAHRVQLRTQWRALPANRQALLVLDGTLIRIDRVSAASRRDGPYYSGKAHAHGMNVQVLADPAGRLI